MDELPQSLKESIETIFRKKITKWIKPDFGLSSTYRFSITFEDLNRVFVKAATDAETTQWLKTEYKILSSLNIDFIPKIIKWIETPSNYPILIMEDLSEAYWPANKNGVKWRKKHIPILIEKIKEISNINSIPVLPHLKNKNYSVWESIAVNPENFLKLKCCSKNWLQENIEYLIRAEKSSDITGENFIHGDIRSDNICFLGSEPKFVDWSNSCIGNKNFDLINFLPTLYLEGGPNPYENLSDAGNEVISLCGSHIERLKNKNLPYWLKNVFRKLIIIELEWSAKSIGIDKPDGINWKSF